MMFACVNAEYVQFNDNVRPHPLQRGRRQE